MVLTSLRSAITSRKAGSRTVAPQQPRTHAWDDDLVVFHIGMTIRKRRRPDLWMPVLAAMPAMLKELQKNREAHERGEAADLGFLYAANMIGPGGPWVVQYWKSVDHLYAYARSSDRKHLPAWRRFNRAAKRHPGAVGIWHETYVVPKDGIETFYGNGADVGLGKATGTVPIMSRGRTARERLATSIR